MLTSFARRREAPRSMFRTPRDWNANDAHNRGLKPLFVGGSVSFFGTM
jgi:hypothetical protein